MVNAPQAERPNLSSLLAGIIDIPTTQDCGVTGLSMDSRSCVAGGLFLAVSGKLNHGLDFLPQALAKGIAAIVTEVGHEWPLEKIESIVSSQTTVPLYISTQLCSDASEIAARFYNQPSKHLHVVGVTGTNGKTSCTHFIAQALSHIEKCAVIGTIGIGFPNNLQPSTHTTPNHIALQAHLRALVDSGAETVAMEVSSHGMEQKRVSAVSFDVAVLTNLTRDHLDYHGTMDAYANAKRALFVLPGLQWAVLNLDDAFGQKLADQTADTTKIVGYSMVQGGARALDYWIEAVEVESSQSGLLISLESSWGVGKVDSTLLGKFNVSNLLAVLATLLTRGIDFSRALKGLGQLRTVPGRMERFGGNLQPLVVVDYAHTPDALEQALVSLRQHTQGHLICLFGCGGDRDRGKRPQMAAIAEHYADVAIVTDDNPRTEDGDLIVKDILAGFEDHQSVQVIRDRGSAIAHGITQATPQDTVLIAGKGHEDYQLVGKDRLNFSDRDCVADILGGRCA